MSNSSNSPRLGLGLSEERKAALQRANRLKQELYAQQKKIQFSNLLERASGDIDSYVESQDNVFISVGHAKSGADVPAGPVQDANQPVGEIEKDDQDGFDYFYKKSFSPSKSVRRLSTGEQDDFVFDPAASSHVSLRDHLLDQIHLDGKYSGLSPELKALCEKIVDKLDSSGYFKVDPNASKSALPANAIAYPDYDEEQEQIVDEFDAMFGIVSTHDDRVRMKNALKDYFDPDSVSKFSRRLAREEFDSVVGRKTTKEERERAKALLDKLEFQSFVSDDPLDGLFSTKPSPEERNQAENALKIVQTLDPPGVGARDFRESLLLRLPKDAPHAHELRVMISEHFEDFLKKRIGVLAEKTGFPAALVSEIYAEPFPFTPAPEQVFASNPSSMLWIQPEVIVERSAVGRWTVRLDDSQQDVELNSEYRKMLLAKRIDKKTKEYLRKQLVEAQALLDALRNRNSTILRVAKAVVDFQYEFFSDAATSPKPLTQQQIADKLGLDSSTVSRACNDKWMATPRGFIAFKTFFPKAVSGDVTRADVAEAIKQIVDQEDKSKPLSDEDITAALKTQFDIVVSRKTVQEHRDRLQIPNSRSRKKSAAKNKA